MVQKERVKQIQNSNRKQDVANPIVEIPFAKHFCYLYGGGSEGGKDDFSSQLCVKLH
ncbi:hypothetical protein [Scytonema sp. NUACC21]